MSDTAPRQRPKNPKLEELERQIGAIAPVGSAATRPPARPTTLFNTVVMLLLFAAGLGLIARGVLRGRGA